MQLVNAKIEEYADRYTGKVDRVFEALHKLLKVKRYDSRPRVISTSSPAGWQPE
jgi:hypothetical protein